jgi:hypothetical protein
MEFLYPYVFDCAMHNIIFLREGAPLFEHLDEFDNYYGSEKY